MSRPKSLSALPPKADFQVVVPAQPPSLTSVKGAQKLGWAYREQLEAVIVLKINAQMHAWRARIVLLSANGVGTMGIRRRTGKGPECLGIGLSRETNFANGQTSRARQPSNRKTLPGPALVGG